MPRHIQLFEDYSNKSKFPMVASPPAHASSFVVACRQSTKNTTSDRSRVVQWMTEIRVLDGGFGSECQKRSSLQIDGHRAWSCRLLKDDPNLVCEIHKSFLRAGCDVISTNTYQAAPTTLERALNISRAEAVEFMRHAVRLARRAINAVLEEESAAQTEASPSPKFRRKLDILVAGSLGAYGACAADGSEYTGSYVDSISLDDLICFHHRRVKVLVEAGVDLIAWETIPALAEVEAICEAMRLIPNAVGWITVASLDGQTTVRGEPLYQVAVAVQKCEQLFGVGVNCCIPTRLIGRALQNLDDINDPCQPGNEEGFHPPPCRLRPGHRDNIHTVGTPKLLLAYPNSGEVWTGSRSRGRWVWPSGMDMRSWRDEIFKSVKRRDFLPEGSGPPKRPNAPPAQWAGGCCRIGPEQIRQLAEWMKPDEFAHSKPVDTVQSINTTPLKRPTTDKINFKAKRAKQN